MILPTCRATLLISSFIFCSGCALFDTPDEISTRELKSPASQIFQASYDEVWRATQKTLVKFPIMVNNIDQGVIETESLQLDLIWPRPFPINNKRQLGKYTLHVNVIKGRISEDNAIRVVILKKVNVERDFFSEVKQLPSDFYEENIILYRIQREITLERSAKRAFEASDS